MTAAAEKRRWPRISVDQGATGRLKATVPVTVIDVSGHGLQIEVASSLRPGSLYDLRADVAGMELAAQVRITRCRAGGYMPDGRGGRFLMYRAGAEFVRFDGGDIKRFIGWVEDNTVEDPLSGFIQAS